MKIITIYIENFRQFENIDINLDENFNIFVADNGAGKSTLKGAIMFCLFGYDFIKSQNVFDDVENKKNLFNKNNQVNKAIVRLKINHNNETYVITRVLNELNNDITSEVSVEKSSLTEVNNKSVDYEEFIKNYPKDFSVFSFISGEQMTTINNAMNQGKNNSEFSNQIKSLIGQDLLDDKLNIVEKAIKHINDKISKNGGVTESKVAKLRNEILKLENQKRTVEQNIEDYERELEFVEGQIEKQSDIIKNNEINTKLKNEYDLLKIKIEDANTEFKLHEAKLLINIIDSRTLYKLFLSNAIDLTNFEKYENLKSDISQKKVENIILENRCICGSALTDEFKSTLVKKSNELSGIEELVKFSKKIISYKVDEHELKSRFEELDENHTKYNDLVRQEKNFDDNYDIKALSLDNKDILNNYKSLLEEKSEINTKLNNNKTIKQDNVISMKKLELEEKELVNEESTNLSNQRIYQIVDQIKNHLKDQIKELGQFDKIFEDRMYEIANEIFTEEVKVTIKKTYIPEITKTNNIGSLSDGEKVIACISYLFALMETVGHIRVKECESDNLFAYPIVLDSLFAKSDSKYTQKLMDKINDYEPQVIMLNNDNHHNNLKMHFKGQYKTFKIEKQSNKNSIIRECDEL